MHLLFEEMQISPKPEQYSTNKVDIRNQRPQLRKNTLFMSKSVGVK